jgi:CubicO group peptidase (beta-lactamase class C family)
MRTDQISRTPASTLAIAFDQQFAKSGLVSAGFGFQRGQGAPEIYVGGTQNQWDAAPVSIDAAWHIGSITKTFTAALACMLAQDGLIDLDVPVVSHLAGDAADMHPSWQNITLSQLLSHRAGMRPNPSRAEMQALYDGALSETQFLSSCWHLPLPGTSGVFQYSNIGYIFAAYVLEVAAGKSWKDLMSSRIVGPLGLSSFGIGPPDRLCGHRSFLGVFKRPVPAGAREADNPPMFTPAGRMHLSIADMLTWGRFLLSAQRAETPLLQGASVQRMMDTSGGDYGVGLMRFQIPGTDYTAWGHDGSNRLWYGLLAIIPERDAVGFVISGEGRINKVAKLGVAMLDMALSANA